MSLIKKFTLIFTVISISSFGQTADYDQLDDYLDTLETNDKLMSNLVISKNGIVEFNKAIGFSNFETSVKNDATTKFRIGSITKTFTAVMIFQLVDEGKISLDTPLDKFFPKIPNSKTIKISNLLNHSSGLFNITSDSNAREWVLEPSDQKKMLSRIVTYDLEFEPGEQTAYSNTNYILLGYIIENLDKRSYKESLNKRIANKIGLENTYYGGKINPNENESFSYVYEDDHWIKQPETDMSNPGGAGAIVSTAADLTTFMNALFKGKLMSSSSFEVMKSSNDNETCHGLFYANMDGLDLFASEGGIDGFQSLLVHVPKSQTTIALTANGLDYSKMRIIMSALATSQGKQIVLPSFTSIELTEAQAKQYEGQYACEKVPYKLTFKAEGNTLMGSNGQGNFKALTPTKQHQFTFDAIGITLDFYPENGMLKLTEGNNEPLIFNKLN